MSVDKVLSYSEWLKTQTNMDNVSNYQRLELYEAYVATQNNSALQQGLNGGAIVDPNKGVVLESGTEGDAGAQDRRADAHASQVAEVTAMKQLSLTPEQQQAVQDAHQAQLERSGNKKAGEYAPVALTEQERQLVLTAMREVDDDNIDNDNPFYKNKKAKKALVNTITVQFKHAPAYAQQVANINQKYQADYDAAIARGDNEEARRLLDCRNSDLAALDKQYEKAAKVYVDSLARKDRVEHTRVFDSKEDKKAYEESHNDTDGLRLEVHNKKYKENRSGHLRTDVSLHQAAFETISDTIGSDGIGDPNEVHNLTGEAGLGTSYGATRSEIKRIGYDVKDDTWKNIAKALIPGVGAFTSAAAFRTTATATADAFAVAVVNHEVTGEILASATAEATATATKTLVNWAAAGAAGATASVLTAALFGGTKDEDVLDGTQIDKVFENQTTTGEKYYKNATFGKYTEQAKVVLAAIDSLEKLTDEEKIGILKAAAGIDSQQILSPKELICAYMAAEQLNKAKANESEPVTPVADPQPEFKSDITEHPKTKEVPTETKLRHIPNLLYGDIMAREGYLRTDGKTLTEKQIKEIWRDIYNRNNFNAANGWKVPKEWILGNQLTLSDGTVVNLKPHEDLLKIKGKPSQNDPRLGFTRQTRNVNVDIRVLPTEYGFIVQKKEVGSDKWTTVKTSGDIYYASRELAQAEADKIIQQLKQPTGEDE